MNKDKVFIEGHVVGLFADALGRKGKQIKVASGDIVDIDDDFIYKSIGPETGHADEAPRYLKNILARLRELPEHDREVWLKVIVGEFEEEFSHAKWCEGYEQGKIEGAWVGNQLKDADKVRRELNKVKVKQFVADWYEEHKDEFEYNVWDWLSSKSELGKIDSKFAFWLNDVDNTPIQTLVNMHQFGYEIEKEKRHRISMPKARNHKNHAQILCEKDGSIFWCGEWYPFRTKFTQKQLEEAGFGWVFGCEGVEIEEVE